SSLSSVAIKKLPVPRNHEESTMENRNFALCCYSRIRLRIESVQLSGCNQLFGLCRIGKHDNVSDINNHEQETYIEYVEGNDKNGTPEMYLVQNRDKKSQSRRCSGMDNLLIDRKVYISNNTFVLILNVENPRHLTQIISDRSEIVNIAVHPYEGDLYFIDLKKHIHNNSITNAIYRANLDGWNIIQITEPVDTRMSALIIDFYTDRLYWRLFEKEDIYHSKLDGSDFKRVHVPGTKFNVSEHHRGAKLHDIPSYSLHSISFDKDYLYCPKKRLQYNVSEKLITKLIQINLIIVQELVVYDPEVQKMKCTSTAKLLLEVADKPNLFVIVANVPGLCHINSTSASSVNTFGHQIIPCNDDHPSDSYKLSQANRPRLLLSPHNFLKMETFRGINYDASKKSIYYASNAIGDREAVKIVKRNFSSSVVEIIFDNTLFVSVDKDSRRKFEVTGLSFDWITGNVYMNTRTSILVINELKSKHSITIIDNRSEIISPVVHPNEGYLYFIDAQLHSGERRNSVRNAIYRSNQDGSNIEQITPIYDKEISTLAIDFYADRLYWSEPSSEVIKHSKLDGSDVKSFRTGLLYVGLYNGVLGSIAVDKDYIYYISKSPNTVQRHKKINVEKDETFKLKANQETPIVELMVYDPDAQQVREDHPCLSNNGDCQKFCFVRSQNDGKLKRSCKCSDGDVLADDEVSCHSKSLKQLSVYNRVSLDEKDVPDKPDIILLTEGNNEVTPAICQIKSFELISTHNYFQQHKTYYQIPLHTRTFTCRQPWCISNRGGGRDRYGSNRLIQKQLSRFRSLCYDARKQLILYFSSGDGFGIIKHHLRVLEKTPVRFANTDIDFRLKDFTYDWITKNVYINGHKRINVANLENPELSKEIISNRKENTNLRVHPNKGYLFFMDVNRRSNKNEKSRSKHAIYRANLDGSNVTRISKFVNETMYGLSIDYYSDRLYWSIPSLKIILHSKLDGTDVKNFSCESYGTIVFDKNYIYYVDGETDSIVRRKKLENEDKDFRINSVQDNRINDFIIYDTESQQIRKDHPCLLNNGDCQQFCFAVSEFDKLKRVCACKTQDELGVDLVSCTPVKNDTSNKCNNSTKPKLLHFFVLVNPSLKKS
ncbi:hypothetical protein TSAR_001948, partial [Trichomalopsis sarcophagae]